MKRLRWLMCVGVLCLFAPVGASGNEPCCCSCGECDPSFRQRDQRDPSAVVVARAGRRARLARKLARLRHASQEAVDSKKSG